jgi:hypothetical protein
MDLLILGSPLTAMYLIGVAVGGHATRQPTSGDD